MPTYYFSGLDRPAHLALLAKEHAAGMVNARLALQPSLQHAYLHQYQTVQLVLDSGAFQHWEDRQAFLAVVEQVGQRFEWISSLDVIGNQQKSNNNFDFLQAHLPLHLQRRLLWIFQSNGSLDELEEMAKNRKLVGLGGLVPLLKQRGVDHVLHMLMRIGERLLSANAQAHVFGISSPSVLFRINHLSWLASVDSSKWLVAYKANQVVRRDGTNQCQAEQLGLCLTSDEMAANNIRVMTLWIAPQQHFTQLLLFDNSLDTPLQREQVALSYTLVRLLGDMQQQERFFDAFGKWILGCDGSEEEDEIFITLAASGDTLEQECAAWCEHARSSGDLKEYTVWRDDERVI